MTPFDRSRFDWYPTTTYNGVTHTAAAVVSSTGHPRPKLGVPLDVFTVHFVGAGAFLDPGDSALELAAIERWHAIPSKKPNEYNSASDSESITWEYAGPYRAAHSAGENTTAWGHLALLGNDIPNDYEADRLIRGIRRARQQAQDFGYLTGDHRVVAHLNMPNAQTSCPGLLYTTRSYWARISAPLGPPEGNMAKLYAAINRDGAADWVHVGDYLWRRGMSRADYDRKTAAGQLDAEWLGTIPAADVRLLGRDLGPLDQPLR